MPFPLVNRCFMCFYRNKKTICMLCELLVPFTYNVCNDTINFFTVILVFFVYYRYHYVENMQTFLSTLLGQNFVQ